MEFGAIPANQKLQRLLALVDGLAKDEKIPTNRRRR